MRMEILVISSASLAFLSLIWMAWIDIKLWILPNELVALYALTALPFHYAIDWYYGGWLLFGLGAVMGGTTLLIIREAANRFYGMETLGLGDIKLMAAAGLWLGPQAILLALSVGALCGVIHAILLAFINKQSLKRMMLPAGPGFIIGIIFTTIWTYKDLIL
jgi:leader peptidase (prepilin peptidase)/N-methyltransferase